MEIKRQTGVSQIHGVQLRIKRRNSMFGLLVHQKFKGGTVNDRILLVTIELKSEPLNIKRVNPVDVSKPKEERKKITHINLQWLNNSYDFAMYLKSTSPFSLFFSFRITRLCSLPTDAISHSSYIRQVIFQIICWILFSELRYLVKIPKMHRK